MYVPLLYKALIVSLNFT
uniref:Uncharacterized protein n=1 Tax=Rhizophora mucronata TaxID=61149 RepID=A0A2P2P4I7_RHIMU